MMWSLTKQFRVIQILSFLSCCSALFISDVTAVTFGNVTSNGSSVSDHTTQASPSTTLAMGLNSYELIDSDLDGKFDRLDVVVVVLPGEELILDQIIGHASSIEDPSISSELPIADYHGFGPAVIFLGQGSYCFEDSDRSLVIDSRRGDVIDLSDDDCIADFYRIGFDLDPALSLPFNFELSIVTEIGNSYLYNAIIEFNGTQTGNPTGAQLDSVQRAANDNGLARGGCSLVSKARSTSGAHYAFIFGLFVVLCFGLVLLNLPNKKGMGS